MSSPTFTPEPWEVESKGNLYACAPELYAELKWLVENLEHDIDLTEAKKVLAKTEGREVR